MEPYFFLSYARADDDGVATARFYHDLSAKLAELDPRVGRPAQLRRRCARDAATALGPDHPIARAAREGARLERHVEPRGF